jgi:serine/threonine protein kinase
MKNEHKNFIKINSITHYNILTMIEMDYVEGYNLFEYFINTTTRKNCYNILFELVFALNYIHNNNIIHGDIKPNNIIIDSKGHPIILDYDLCKYINNNLIETNPFGTKIFMPPELINDNVYMKKSDIWSLGLSFTISILYKYITYDENIFNYDTYKLLYYFNANKEYLIKEHGKLFVNSINSMIAENYKIRVSSNTLTDILKQSNYYAHINNATLENNIKISDKSNINIKI